METRGRIQRVAIVHLLLYLSWHHTKAPGTPRLLICNWHFCSYTTLSTPLSKHDTCYVVLFIFSMSIFVWGWYDVVNNCSIPKLCTSILIISLRNWDPLSERIYGNLWENIMCCNSALATLLVVASHQSARYHTKAQGTPRSLVCICCHRLKFGNGLMRSQLTISKGNSFTVISVRNDLLVGCVFFTTWHIMGCDWRNADIYCRNFGQLYMEPIRWRSLRKSKWLDSWWLW